MDTPSPSNTTSVLELFLLLSSVNRKTNVRARVVAYGSNVFAAVCVKPPTSYARRLPPNSLRPANDLFENRTNTVINKYLFYTITAVQLT